MCELRFFAGVIRGVCLTPPAMFNILKNASVLNWVLDFVVLNRRSNGLPFFFLPFSSIDVFDKREARPKLEAQPDVAFYRIHNR